MTVLASGFHCLLSLPKIKMAESMSGAKRGCHSSLCNSAGRYWVSSFLILQQFFFFIAVISNRDFLVKHYNFSQGTAPEGLLRLLRDSRRKEGESAEDMRHRIYRHFYGILWVCAFAIVLPHRAFFS